MNPEVLVDVEGREYIKTLLSELELKMLEELSRNQAMKEALRKTLLAVVYSNGTLSPERRAEPRRNFMLSLTSHRDLTNDELAQRVRAASEAVALIEIGFGYLDTFRPKENKVELQTNKAR